RSDERARARECEAITRERGSRDQARNVASLHARASRAESAGIRFALPDVLPDVGRARAQGSRVRDRRVVRAHPHALGRARSSRAAWLLVSAADAEAPGNTRAQPS